MVFEKTDILLPKIKDYRKWAVVACDQFTSQPEYWENVQKYVGDEVSTYNLILPEAQLSENNDDKIASINETMNSYLKRNIFETYNDSYIYVERKELVSALRVVDEVVSYTDVDVTIKTLDFDVFAVGEDQNHAGFQRAIEWCKENGKEVVRMKRTPGICSSEIKKSL